MSEPTNGGPAFPVVISIDADTGGGDWPVHSVNSTDGMSLRDYFAAAALTGLLAHPNQSTDVPAFAKAAYHFADAMLKERIRQGGLKFRFSSQEPTPQTVAAIEEAAKRGFQVLPRTQAP